MSLHLSSEYLTSLSRRHFTLSISRTRSLLKGTRTFSHRRHKMPPLLFPLLLLSFATTLTLTTASTLPSSLALAKRSSDSLMHCSNDLPALCKGGTRVAVNVLCMCDNQKPPCDGWQCPAFWTLRQVSASFGRVVIGKRRREEEGGRS